MHYNLRHGNLTSRSDSAMVFNYGEFGHSPHALTSVDAPIGSCQNRSVSYSYTDFKMLESAASGEDSIHITYGADLQRRKMQVFRNGRLSLTRYYFSNYEEEHYADGRIRKIDYITGPKGLIGVNISSDGTDTLLHAFTDKFGNLVLLADADGNVVERLAYDPWGARRNPADWTKADTACHAVPRGYSMHEHLDRLGLINMNARVYDVTTCSFLSPDPLIADEGNWLNYNRYLYCLGNPVKFADPTGMYATYNEAADAQRNAIFQGYETGPIMKGYGTGEASYYFNTVALGGNGDYVVTANYSGYGAYTSADYGALMAQDLRTWQAIDAIIDENNRRLQESFMAAVKVDVPEVNVEPCYTNPFVGSAAWNTLSNVNNGAAFMMSAASKYLGDALDYSSRYHIEDYSSGYPDIRFKTPVGNIYTRNIGAVKTAANVLKGAGIVTGILGLAMTVSEIRKGQKSWIGEGGLDLVMGVVGFCGSWGWAISGAYFGGKMILEATGNKFW